MSTNSRGSLSLDPILGSFEKVEDNESETDSCSKTVPHLQTSLDVDVPMTLPPPDLPCYNLYIPDGKPDHEIPITLPPDDYVTHDLTSGDTRSAFSGSQGLSELHDNDTYGLSAVHETESDGLPQLVDDSSTDGEYMPHLTSESSDDERMHNQMRARRKSRIKRNLKFSSCVSVLAFDIDDPPNSACGCARKPPIIMTSIV